MKPTSGDGGDPFHATSDITRGRKERYRQSLDTSVLAPLRIILSDWRGKFGLSVITLYALLGTIGVIAVPVPTTDATQKYMLPFQSLEHPLGTGPLGRDIFGMIVHATPAMLLMILGGAVFTTVVATIVGTVSGYKGGTVDKLLMMATDVAMTIPGMPLIIVLSVILEPKNPLVVGVILSINSWAGLARALRSQVLTLRDESYVEASRVMGLKNSTILHWNVLPNLFSYIMIRFVEAARGIIFGSVALYFLGILSVNNLNWGVMLNEAYNRGAIFSVDTVHALLIPMLVIVLLAYSLILFAQATDRVFNPRIRAKHESSD